MTWLAWIIVFAGLACVYFYAGLLGLGILSVALVSGIIYFVPAFIAFRRGHRNRGAILALNLFLGWTFLGWVAAIVWSLTDNVEPPRVL